MEAVYLRKKVTAFALALLSALLLMCPTAQAASAAQGDYIAANHTKSNGKPYYIMVNRAQSTVTIYGLDDSGCYTVPVKAMICSTGRKGHATPLGTYSLGGKWTWVHMFDNSYGQYVSQISGNILFHSVCYDKKDPSTLITEEYNGLGAPASLGCVRLQTADAKWIYDNCARGTKITIYDGADPGPLGKPGRVVDHITPEQANGWDPTDPREENPWHGILAAAQEPEPIPSAIPSAPVPSATPSAPVPSAAPSAPVPSAVPSAPVPSAAPSQPPEEERVSYAQVAQALYELSGGTELTHPSETVTWAVRYRLLDNIVDRGFDPYNAVTRQDMAFMFYRYETQYCRHTARNFSSLTRFSDWQSIHLYARDAMRWNLGNSLIQPVSDNTLRPDNYVAKDQLDTALGQYRRLHG